MNVKEPDRVSLELLPLWLVTLALGQSADPVPLPAPVQRRSRQVRDRRLQGKETIVERQHGVAAERDDHRFLYTAENSRTWLLRSGLAILHRLTPSPLGDGLWIDPELPAQCRGRSLRSLYCCSDGVRGRGAAVTNLSHRSSFHSNERITPSKHGSKHLVP